MSLRTKSQDYIVQATDERTIHEAMFGECTWTADAGDGTYYRFEGVGFYRRPFNLQMGIFYRLTAHDFLTLVTLDKWNRWPNWKPFRWVLPWFCITRCRQILNAWLAVVARLLKGAKSIPRSTRQSVTTVRTPAMMLMPHVFGIVTTALIWRDDMYAYIPKVKNTTMVVGLFGQNGIDLNQNEVHNRNDCPTPNAVPFAVTQLVTLENKRATENGPIIHATDVYRDCAYFNDHDAAKMWFEQNIQHTFHQ